MTSTNRFKGVFTPVISCLSADAENTLQNSKTLPEQKTETTSRFLSSLPFSTQEPSLVNELEQRLLINYLFDKQQVDGIVACASTGEGVLLSDDEYWKIAKICLEECQKKKKLAILATTHFNYDFTINRNHQAKEWGFDAVLITQPPYIKPNEAGIKSYFKEISKRSSVPIILYNIWYRTGGSPMNAKTIIELSRYDNIVGIKDCGVAVDHVDEVIENTDRKSFAYLCGEDALYYNYLMHGGDGTIGAPSHIVGKLMKEMLIARDSSKLKECLEIHRKIKKIIALLFAEPNPSCFKAALTLLGVCKSVTKYPAILPASNETIAKLEVELKEVGIPKP